MTKRRNQALPLLLLLVTGWLAIQPAKAQSTAKLTVSMNIQPSIQLIFQNNANVGQRGYCSLTNSGTNAVAVDLGIGVHAWPWVITDGCAALTGAGTSGNYYYQLTTSFDVVVAKFNSSSANYSLQAELAAAPPTGVSWLVGNQTLNTSYVTLDTADTYSATVTKALSVRVTSSASDGQITQTIYFLATAN